MVELNEYRIGDHISYTYHSIREGSEITKSAEVKEKEKERIRVFDEDKRSVYINTAGRVVSTPVGFGGNIAYLGELIEVTK